LHAKKKGPPNTLPLRQRASGPEHPPGIQRVGFPLKGKRPAQRTTIEAARERARASTTRESSSQGSKGQGIRPKKKAHLHTAEAACRWAKVPKKNKAHPTHCLRQRAGGPRYQQKIRPTQRTALGSARVGQGIKKNKAHPTHCLRQRAGGPRYQKKIRPTQRTALGSARVGQ